MLYDITVIYDPNKKIDEMDIYRETLDYDCNGIGHVQNGIVFCFTDEREAKEFSEKIRRLEYILQVDVKPF